LFEGTQKDNIHDMIAKRRDRIVGARHGNAKLTDEQVAEIRSLGAPWVRSHSSRGPQHRGLRKLVRDLAKRFGVTTSTIKEILRDETYVAARGTRRT
jgi:hypothetical protein